MDRRGSNVVPAAPSERDEVAVAIARTAFSAWLRAAREQRGLRLEDVARVTRIQLRTLERLEQAAFNELPADVFVRGFIRNYARVVGLDADDAIARYDGCGVSPGPVAAAKAKAFVDVFEAGPTRPAGVQSVVRRLAQATPSEPTPIVAPGLAAGSITEIPKAEPVLEAAAVVEAAPIVEAKVVEVEPVVETAPAVEAAQDLVEDPKPRRKRGKRGGKGRTNRAKKQGAAAPAIEVVETPAAPDDDLEVEITFVEEIVRPAIAAAPRIVVPSAPTLVIDDDDPDRAEREREERAAKDRPRSFLPQALLDNDRGSRQGGLTLAVIILLIVATLTLSYLMRRPSAGGEGVTALDSSADVA